MELRSILGLLEAAMYRAVLKDLGKWFVVLTLAVLLVEVGKIHRHLHVLECALRGEISDTDYSRWPDSDEICPKIPLLTGEERSNG